MKVTLNANQILVHLEGPKEKEIADWLWSQYQEHFLTNHLTKLWAEKYQAKLMIEMRQEVESRGGNDEP